MQMPAVAYRIRPGDTLTRIAQEQLGGAGEWPRLFAFNNMPEVLKRGGARISDPDRIRAGDTIYLPVLRAAAPRAAAPPGVLKAPGPAALLGPMLPRVTVPLSLAYDLDHHLVTLEAPTHSLRVYTSCRFALIGAQPVALTLVHGGTLEASHQTRSREAFLTLVQDTTVSVDPRKGGLSIQNSLIAGAQAGKAPRVVQGFQLLPGSGRVVWRAELEYPEVSGKVGADAFVATQVRVVIEIEPKAPPLVPVPVPVSHAAPARPPREAPVRVPGAPPFPIQTILLALPDRGTLQALYEGLKTPAMIVGALVLTAGFAAWVYVTLGTGTTLTPQYLAAMAALLAATR